ncbi:serine hydrolase [Pelomyxa schiedti]|nr:serine hydrolase [Pelomyxa schiedti]
MQALFLLFVALAVSELPGQWHSIGVAGAVVVVGGAPVGVDVEYQLGDSEYPDTPANDTVGESIVRIMGLRESAGMSAGVLLVNDSKPAFVWEGAYGWQNLSTLEPYTADTVIRVASISKQISAIALLQQMELGRCQLDDDVSTHLNFVLRNPYFPDVPITLRQLMDHTSSINDYYVDFAMACYTAIGPYLSIQDLLLPGGAYYDEEALWNSKHYPGDPDGYVYSNTNPMVIATVVEVLSGERFDQYCTKHIFSPLEMYHTSLNIMDFPAEEADTDFASIYYYLYPEEDKPGFYVANCGLNDRLTYDNETIYPIPYDDYIIGTNGGLFGPQGGMRTSLHDFMQLMLLHINRGYIIDSNGEENEVLTQSSMDIMHSPQWSGYIDGEYQMYGLYQEITNSLAPDGTTLVGHTGGAYGYASSFI